MRFEIFKTKDNQFAWHLKSKNGEIVASSESYIRKENAIGCIDLLKTSVREDTPVIDLTKEERT